MSIFTTEIYFQAEGIDLEISIDVDYDYIKECRGSRDRDGQQLEPDDPEEIQLNSFALNNKDPSSLESAIFDAYDNDEENNDYLKDIILNKLNDGEI